MGRKTYTLYLTKLEPNNWQDALTESAREKLGTDFSIYVNLPDFSDQAHLVVFTARFSTPPWYSELQRKFGIEHPIRNQSACAILFFEIDERLFAITFAHGWMCLDDRHLERDFGLRVSINALDQGKLKRLDRTNLGDAMKASALSPFQRDFNSFGIDDALDLVRSLSGATRDDVTADAMTGAYSLKLNGEFELEDLPNLASEALELFQSNAYQETTFRVLDVLRPVNDRMETEHLDAEAVRSIIANDGSFELGLPGEAATDCVAYGFVGPGLKGKYPDLLLEHYIAAMGDKLPTLDREIIKNHKIVASYEAVGIHDDSWSVHRALIGSTVLNQRTYAINDGLWYNVEQAFKQSIEESYLVLLENWDDPPTPFRKLDDPQGKREAFEREDTYNEAAAARLGYVLMDKQLVYAPDIQRSGFEVCDLLDVAGKRLIHVKRNSRKSSVLSHFFKQAGNSGTQLQRFASCWDGVRDIILRENGELMARAFDVTLDDERKWKIEFWIADTERQVGGFNIPFFSKISLRNEVTSLQAMNFDVGIKFIGLQAANLR
ncbi:MAG: TIGR04141 family sporadically distributed protein [Sphingopyxis sp.]|jgi:uncharacterized protein (TIGR04141 family)|uniref:TIGR04141 family sporadically distributed protein n=3 Tax=Sphingopyxis sp. TaxID=1908224 RepID=UPI003F705C09